MSADELRPCPFCGDTRNLHEHDAESPTDRFVACNNCDTTGPCGSGSWNTRPLEQELLEALDKLLSLYGEQISDEYYGTGDVYEMMQAKADFARAAIAKAKGGHP